MAVVELIYDVKPYSYITSNPTKILSNGEPIYLSDGRYGFGDGITTLSSLPLYGGIITPSGLIKYQRIYNDIPVVTTASSLETIDWQAANVYTYTVTTTTSFTFSNPTDGQTIIVGIQQNGTGGNSYIFTTPIIWSGGATPSGTTTPNKMDIYTFIGMNGNVYGSAILNF